MATRVDCDVCGASWSPPVRWCGSCGAALDPAEEATSPPSARAEGRGPWPWVLGAVVVAVGVVVGGLLVGPDRWGGTSPPVDDDVALPDEGELAVPEAGDRAVGAGGSRMACAPPGCQVWRIDDPVGQGVVASGELVLRVGREEMVAHEAVDGRVRWRRPTPDQVDRSPHSVAVSDHGVALVQSGGTVPALGPDSTADPEPARIRVHDPVDGHHRFDLDLDADVDLGLTWVGDLLVAAGTDTVPGGLVGRVVVADAEGEVVWRHEGQGPVQLDADGTTLLQLGGDRVRRLDLVDGEVAWQVPGSLAAPPGETLLVRDRASGQVRVVDPTDGRVRTTVPAGGSRGVRTLGPWVVVAHDEELLVHDRSSGQLLFRRRGPGALEALRMATAVQVGDRVVVAWSGNATGGEGVELAVHTLDGQQERTLEVPTPSEGPGPTQVRLHHVGPGREVVHVGTWRPDGWVVAVHLGSGEVVGRGAGGVAGARDGLLVIHRQDGLSILGPGGEVRVRHVDQLASTDPLVVHGAGGMMRLDRGLITGEDDGS